MCIVILGYNAQYLKHLFLKVHKMKHINELNFTHSFIMQGKFIAIKSGKRNIVKIHSKHFSNYPLLYVVLNGTRYQINDKQFDFKHGII